MILKLVLLCLFNASAVSGFKMFGLDYRYVIEEKQMAPFHLPCCEPIFERWIQQKLDHFDVNNTRMWEMRYYERLDFSVPNGPIYLCIAGESEAKPNKLVKGMVYDLAKDTNGAMFVSEHRYYGKSQPINWENFNVKDLKYLSASQALADNAMLLWSIKRNPKFNNSKVVVIGGSYAGNLAAWMKVAYPDLVDAVISSSAPVLAKRDFDEYLELVGANFKKYGSPGCLDTIQNKFKTYHTLFQSEQGIKQLKEDENICEDINMTKPENKHFFFLEKTYIFSVISQYGNTENITNYCLKLMNATFTPPPIHERMSWNQGLSCYEYDFDKKVQTYYYKKNHEHLSWTYQACTEFGYFITTTSDDQPFTKNIPVEYYDKLCTALFDEGFGKSRNINGINITNNIFSGKSPNVTKVVFVNGELDPWSALGVLDDISSDAPAVYIPRSSHCKDLQADEENDHEELRQARTHIKSLIKKWIGAT